MIANAFEISLSWEIEDGVTLPLSVRGTITPPVAVSRRGHPDTWTDGEGGILEDLEVFSGARLSPEIERGLVDDEDFIIAVFEAIEEQA